MSRTINPSVIIAHHNQLSTLKRLLTSLGSQIPSRKCEVIICDDGSTPPPGGPWLKEIAAQFPNLLLKLAGSTTRTNCVAKMRNLGIQSADGDYCIFLDADMLISPCFIQAHLNNAEEKTILCGTRIGVVVESETCLDAIDIAHGLDSEEIRRSASIDTLHIARSASPWRACMGANFSVDRTSNLWFNEIFVGRAPEDLELGLRLWHHWGYKIKILKDACGLHIMDTHRALRWTNMSHEDIKLCLKNAHQFIKLYPSIDCSEVLQGLRIFTIDKDTRRWRTKRTHEMMDRTSLQDVLELATEHGV